MGGRSHADQRKLNMEGGSFALLCLAMVSFSTENPWILSVVPDCRAASFCSQRVQLRRATGSCNYAAVYGITESVSSRILLRRSLEYGVRPVCNAIVVGVQPVAEVSAYYGVGPIDKWSR